MFLIILLLHGFHFFGLVRLVENSHRHDLRWNELWQNASSIFYVNTTTVLYHLLIHLMAPKRHYSGILSELTFVEQDLKSSCFLLVQAGATVHQIIAVQIG